MTKPPYPQQGGAEPGSEQPGSPRRGPTGPDDEPTQRMGPRTAGQREQTRQFPQPPYGQQPDQYAQPGSFGQPPYGQPPYGQPPYGPPGPYGQQPYGQYGQPGQPWAPPGMTGGQPPKSNKNTLIALVVAGVVVLAALGAGLWLVLHDGGNSSGPSSSTSESAAIPPATADPEGLGEDPVMDRYAGDCHDGDMEACDTLFRKSERGSDYKTYGGTCAGRQAIEDATTVYCRDAFPAD
jgi:hypothetical protein